MCTTSSRETDTKYSVSIKCASKADSEIQAQIDDSLKVAADYSSIG